MANHHVITWLHISDLHFRYEHKWEQTIVLNSLMRDVLPGLRTEGLLPDLVFVTGDIANSGRPEEYLQAQRFFNELAQLTNTDPKSSWFIIPGNHDVDLAQIKPLAQMSATALQDTAQVNAILEDVESRALFACRQRAFFDFASSFLGTERGWSERSPWNTTSVSVNGLEVAILSLNTSWSAQGGDTDQGRLMLGDFQVRELLANGDVNSPMLKIALMHHPLDWLRSFDQERAKSLLFGKGGVEFLLRGHLHMGRINRQDNPDARCIELAAGALWENATYPHGVTVVRLDANAGQGEVHLFRYSPEGRGFWKRDNFLYEDINDGKWIFDVPKGWALAGAKTRISSGEPIEEKGKRSESTKFPGGLNCHIEWDRSSYRVGSDLCTALVMMQIEEPKHGRVELATDMRTPVHHILVLDVSGSMDTPDKYPVLTEAVDFYIRTLSATDLLSLIPFSSYSEILLSGRSISNLRQQKLAVDGLLSSWDHRFNSTYMAPALSLACEAIDQVKNSGFNGVVRLLCLTDGQLHDYIECRPIVHAIRERGVSPSIFGFGEDFDADSAEALADEGDGTVRYVQTTGKELEEYFGHMARTSQRIVLRDAKLSLHLRDGVTCFNVFSCRPHERHIGRFDDSDSAIVTHHMGALRFGTPYILLFELRAWTAQDVLAELQFEATGVDGPTQFTQQLVPSFGPTVGMPNDFVQKMSSSVSGLIRTDRETQIAALEARIVLYKREGRAPQHVTSLERQLEVIRRGGSLSELSANDQHYAQADLSTATRNYMPMRFDDMFPEEAS